MRSSRLCKRQVAAAAHQLKRLHDELDLADAARAELDVVLQLAPFDLARNHPFHLAQRLEHAEVEIAAIDERTQHFVVQLGVMLDRSQRARLDVCISLPVAAVLLQIVLEGGEAQRDPAAVAERAQPQVHAVDEAFDRRRGQQLHDLLTQAQEKLRVVDRARAVGFAALRVEKNEIDVGAEIQLAAAELAHPQDHQLLRLPAVDPTRDAVTGDQRLIHICAGEPDAGVGQRRKIAQRFVEIGPAGDIAPRDAHHVSPAEATQCLHHFRFARAAHALANVASKPIFCGPLEQRTASNQLAQQLRGTQTCRRNEIAASPHARQGPVDAFRGENLLPCAGIMLTRGVQTLLAVGQ